MDLNSIEEIKKAENLALKAELLFDLARGTNFINRGYTFSNIEEFSKLVDPVEVEKRREIRAAMRTVNDYPNFEEQPINKVFEYVFDNVRNEEQFSDSRRASYKFTESDSWIKKGEKVNEWKDQELYQFTEKGLNYFIDNYVDLLKVRQPIKELKSSVEEARLKLTPKTEIAEQMENDSAQIQKNDLQK